MFTQRCFIRKNTKELVEKLKELGYNPYYSARNNYGNSLQTCCHESRGAIYGYEDKIDNDSDDLAGGINCGTNEELFLAIAALRDDSDKHQWFVDPCGYWHFNPTLLDGLRKATVEELIEHFKP